MPPVIDRDKGTMIEMTVFEPIQARPSKQCGSGLIVLKKGKAGDIRTRFEPLYYES